MSTRRELTLGKTVLGQTIEAYHIGPPDYAVDKPGAILYGAIHGDEPLGVSCLVRLLEELVAQPPGRPTWIIPALNLDGLAAGTKNNANDIDLNRNFAAKNWSPEFKVGYNPGSSPESEPETRALSELIESSGATRLIALHSPFRTVNYDGNASELAEEMGKRNGYGATDSIGYATPGSFGSKYGVDRGFEVITLEIPFMTEAQAWQENRSALRYALDLES